jgi:hypothetical protein
MIRSRTILDTGSLMLGLGMAAPLSAQTVPALGEGVTERLSNQAERISEGIRDGSLRTFTPRERQKALHDENRLARQIYRQRHDGQRRQ